MNALVYMLCVIVVVATPVAHAQEGRVVGQQAVVIEQTRRAADGIEQRGGLANLVGASDALAPRAQVGVWELPPDTNFNDLQRRIVVGNYPFRVISLTTAPDILATSAGTVQLPGFEQPAQRLEFSKLDVFRPTVTGVSLNQATAVSKGQTPFALYKVAGTFAAAPSAVQPAPPATSFQIDLSPTDSMRLAVTSISSADEGRVRASFRWVDGDGEAFLERTQNTVFGSIRRGSDVFAVVTTANGDTLAQPMPTLSANLHPSSTNDVVPCTEAAFSNLVGNPEFVSATASATMPRRELRVLFVATRELQQRIALPVLWMFAKQSLVGLDNQFQLQKVPLTAVPAFAGVVGLNYSENCTNYSKECWRQLCRDVVGGAGDMKPAHQARNQHKADIVILLVERTDARGLSADIGAPASNGFIVMAYNALGAPDTTAHEIAHLAGAYHHPTCGASVTIQGRHGYRSADGLQATLEAGVCKNPDSRVQTLWSDPSERMLGGYPGGDTCCNTSGLLRGAAARLAGFR